MNLLKIAAGLLLPAWGALAVAGPVDINTADAATLAKELDGVGPARAQAIVEYRETAGPFERPEDLAEVSGIGRRVLEANEGNILVSKPGEGRD